MIHYWIDNRGCSFVIAKLLARRFVADRHRHAQQYEYGGLCYVVQWGKTGIVVRAL